MVAASAACKRTRDARAADRGRRAGRAHGGRQRCARSAQVKTQHRLRGGKLALEMQVYGGGEPLLFLHGAGGLQEDDPFLTRLGQHFKVYAPHLPGYGNSTGAELIEDVIDAALMYHQLMDELEIASAYILGHSMGGMLACEVAALDIHRARRLMLAAPAGL